MDGDAFLTIHGTNGTKTPSIKLIHKDPKRDLYEKGNIDNFTVISFNVGEISKINISHDGKSLFIMN